MTLKTEKYPALYQASLELFADFGYRKTTVEDVAVKLDMTKGNLYFYVKNKKQLYEQTITHALTQWKDHVKKAVDKKSDPVEKFRVMAVSALAYIEKNAPLRQVIIKDPQIFTLSPREDRFAETNQAAMVILKDILKQGVAQKKFYPMDVDQVTAYLFSVYMMFLIKTYVNADQASSKKLFAIALELNLRGLLNHTTDRLTPIV
ncbi:MAG: TetR/AcrR family transcriptional regulator [Proteobacteria bacterium]|nr:TetR/AcrR family transcriptional regulator [Desulfobacula sp.]MBU4131887.1 TetR/AcrR family transcriptional regulator [Pseudomonadota bacterium]